MGLSIHLGQSHSSWLRALLHPGSGYWARGRCITGSLRRARQEECRVGRTCQIVYLHVMKDTPATVGIPGAQAQRTALVLLTALHGHPCHLEGDRDRGMMTSPAIKKLQDSQL